MKCIRCDKRFERKDIVVRKWANDRGDYKCTCGIKLCIKNILPPSEFHISGWSMTFGKYHLSSEFYWDEKDRKIAVRENMFEVKYRIPYIDPIHLTEDRFQKLLLLI